MSFTIFAVTAVGVLRQVRHGNYAELSISFRECIFGIAEEIGSVPVVIGAR